MDISNYKALVEDVVVPIINVLKWPFVVVVVVLFFRKQISRCLSSIKTIRKDGVDFDSSKKNDSHEDVISDQSSVVEMDSTSNEDVCDKDQCSDLADFFVICNNVSSANVEESKKDFEDFIHNSDGENVKFYKSLFWKNLFIKAHLVDIVDDFSNLFSECYNDKDRVNVLRWWSQCYKEIEEYSKQRDVIKEHIDSIESSESVTTLIRIMAESYIAALDYEKAYEIILDRLNLVDTDSETATLLEVLSVIEEKRGNKINSALCLDTSCSLNVNKVDSLFSSAYALSSAGLTHLSMYNYYLLLSLSPSNNGAYNNLGVSYQELGLRNNSISCYLKSVEQGSTLACANLGYRYLHSGFIDDAKKMVQLALGFPEETHKNVFELQDAIIKSENDENDSFKTYKESAYLVKQHLYKYVKCYYSVVDEPDKYFQGKWIDQYGNELEVDAQNEVLNSMWDKVIQKTSSHDHGATKVEYGYQMSIQGDIHNRTAKVSYKRKSVGDGMLTGMLTEGVGEFNSLYSYLSENGDWVIFSTDVKTSFDMKMTRAN